MQKVKKDKFFAGFKTWIKLGEKCLMYRASRNSMKLGVLDLAEWRILELVVPDKTRDKVSDIVRCNSHVVKAVKHHSFL